MAEIILGILFALGGVRCVSAVADAHMPINALFWAAAALACFALSAFLFFGG